MTSEEDGAARLLWQGAVVARHVGELRLGGYRARGRERVREGGERKTGEKEQKNQFLNKSFENLRFCH